MQNNSEIDLSLKGLKARFEGQEINNSFSPAGNWLAHRLEKIEKGMATISLTVKHEMTNPFGNLHGGMMAVIMDETIGWSVLSLESEQHYTSLNLNVDFLYGISEGERLECTATVVRQGKKVIHLTVEVRHAEKQTLLGLASSNLIASSWSAHQLKTKHTSA